MAVSFVAFGAAVGLGGATTAQPGLPAGVAAGDLMICFVETDDTDGAPAADSNWTAFPTAPAAKATNSTRLTLFYRIYVAADVGPVITPAGGSNHSYSVVGAWTGNSRGSPFNVIGASLNDQVHGTLSLPTITTNQDGTMVVMASSRSDDATAAHYSNWTNANLGSVSERFDAGTSANNGGGLGIADGTKATAGLVGASTFDAATGGTDTYCGIQFAINPAALKKTYAGSITPTGTLNKLTSKVFAGSITPVGALTAVIFKTIALAGSIAPVGTLIKKTSKSLAGTITPTGLLTKLTSKPFSGSITPTGTLTKLSAKVFSGSITPTGTLSKMLAKTFSGSITPTGSLTKQVIHHLLTPVIDGVKTIASLASRAVAALSAVNRNVSASSATDKHPTLTQTSDKNPLLTPEDDVEG